MVTIPAVPPNSSITQAIDFLSLLNLFIRSVALMLSGTVGMGNKISFTVAGCLNRSN